MDFLHIGFGNYIHASKIIGILDIDTSPIRNVVQAAKQMGIAYDITKDKKAKSIIVCTDGVIFVTPISSLVLSQRASRI